MRKFLLFIILLSYGIVNAQQTILLESRNVIDGIRETIPTRDIEETPDGITVTYEFNAITRQDDPLFKNASIVNINGFGYNDTASEPRTLFRWDSFVVPKNTKIEVLVLDSSYVDIPMELTPARPPLFDKANGIRHLQDNVDTIEPYEGFYPSNLISETRMHGYRGVSIFDICFNPLKYDYTNKRIRVYTRVVYRLNYFKDIIINKDNKDITNTERIDEFDSFIINTTLNGATKVEKTNTNNGNPKNWGNPTTPNYYIISVPAYEEAVNKLAEWKSMLGFNVSVLMENSWTVSTLKQRLNYSSTHENYLLIIGDQNDVPAEYKSFTVNGETIYFYSDFTYAYRESEYDIFLPIYSGRLPVSSNAEALNAVNKIIEYERNPTTNYSFYHTGLNSASFEDSIPMDSCEDRRFVLTSERVRNYLITKGVNVNRVYNKATGCIPWYWNNGDYANGGLIPDSLRLGNFDWGGQGVDIANYINSGSFYVLYRGHGQDIGWVNPAFDSYVNIPQLTNIHKYPVIFSLTCLSGNFASPNECLIEYLIRHQYGCVAAFAATASSDTGANDGIAEGIFDTLWPSPGLIPVFPGKTTSPNYPYVQEYRLGKLLAQSIYKASKTWHTILPNAYMYHCFGDPSMRIYTQTPSSFSGITIERLSDGVYVDIGSNTDATISFYNREHGSISYEGCTQAEVTTDPDEIVVCISAPNKIPLIDDPTEEYYIQNETVTGTRIVHSNNILVGKHVTDLKPQGDVIFDGNQVTLIGKTVTLNTGTKVEVGTEFEIQNDE